MSVAVSCRITVNFEVTHERIAWSPVGTVRQREGRKRSLPDSQRGGPRRPLLPYAAILQELFFDNFIGNVTIGFHCMLPNLESDLLLLFPSLLRHITLSHLVADQTVEAAFERIVTLFPVCALIN